MIKSKSKLTCLGHGLLYCFLYFLLFCFMIPFFMVLINSLKTKITIIKAPLAIFEPGGPAFENYINAIESMNYPLVFANSFIITIFSVLLILTFASMAAYLFVRVNWRINKIVFYCMIAGMVVPFQSLMIPLVSLYGAQLNLLNLRSTLIFMYVGFGSGMAVFIYHGFIKSSIPISLEEAAKIDGCNKLRTFFLIVFPLLKPITATLVVLDVLWIWNDYLLPFLVLGKPDLYTLPLSTFKFYGEYSVEYGGLMAALILTIMPIMILFLFLQKQIIGGVVSGAVKG